MTSFVCMRQTGRGYAQAVRLGSGYTEININSVLKQMSARESGEGPERINREATNMAPAGAVSVNTESKMGVCKGQPSEAGNSDDLYTIITRK